MAHFFYRVGSRCGGVGGTGRAHCLHIGIALVGHGLYFDLWAGFGRWNGGAQCGNRHTPIAFSGSVNDGQPEFPDGYWLRNVRARWLYRRSALPVSHGLILDPQ